MKQRNKDTNRINLSTLSEKNRQNSAKIDMLEDRLSQLERTSENSVTATKILDSFKEKVNSKRDQIRTKTIHVSRAADCVIKGAIKASNDLAEAFSQARKVVKNGRDDVARDIERSVSKSKAAIKGGLNKAKNDVDKSAKVAMRIVGS